MNETLLAFLTLSIISTTWSIKLVTEGKCVASQVLNSTAVDCECL